IIAVNKYIQTDNNFKMKEIVLNEAAILKEILFQSNSNSSSDESNIEIEKIFYSVTLEQYKLLIQYVK
ncbi:5686_t:CDS:1, partial [Cetraspora pellucida]